jgi:hypothetical protein
LNILIYFEYFKFLLSTIRALNSFLQFLHCLNEPSLVKFTVLLEEQKIQSGEKAVLKPFPEINSLKLLNSYAEFKGVC